MVIFQFIAAAGLLGVVLLGLLRADPPVRESKSTASVSKSVFQTTCATCHGTKGEGKHELMAPPIANLADWYVEEQLRKFRTGTRGSEPRDLHGRQMQAAVKNLNEEQIKEAIEELITLPLVIPEPTIEADLANGREAYRENCMECHRYNGHGEMVFKSASLAGLPAWYLEAQMQKYLEGIRGYHPDDETGGKMRTMAIRPQSPEELKDIIAYITTLSEEYPVEKMKRGATRETSSNQE